MTPSKEELLQAVETCPFEQIILLPNNGYVIPSAQLVPKFSNKRVYVVPSDSMPGRKEILRTTRLQHRR